MTFITVSDTNFSHLISLTCWNLLYLATSCVPSSFSREQLHARLATQILPWKHSTFSFQLPYAVYHITVSISNCGIFFFITSVWNVCMKIQSCAYTVLQNASAHLIVYLSEIFCYCFSGNNYKLQIVVSSHDIHRQ